jgi:hypothetical protein
MGDRHSDLRNGVTREANRESGGDYQRPGHAASIRLFSDAIEPEPMRLNFT